MLEDDQTVSPAPVLLLIFRRPDTTAKVLERIREARPAKLYVAADAPREGREDDVEACAATRQLVDEGIDWDCEVKRLYREENLGCRLAVSGGISWFFEQESEGIILEDDTVPHLDFFRYATELLARYRGNERVMHIGGFSPVQRSARGRSSYYFSHYPQVWGWATWERAWKHYRDDMQGWEAASQDPDFWSRMASEVEANRMRLNWLEVMAETQDTWDYRWAFTIHQMDGLTALPEQNLVENAGLNHEVTTHTAGALPAFFSTASGPLKWPLRHPQKIERDLAADRQMDRLNNPPPPWPRRVWKRIRRELGRMP